MALFLYAFNLLCKIVIGLLFARAILSFIVNPYNANRYPGLSWFYFFVTRVTEPLVRPSRRLLSRFRTGPLDFSLFLTMIFIYVIENIVYRIAIMF